MDGVNSAAWKAMMAQAGRCGWKIDKDTGELLDKDEDFSDAEVRKRAIYRKRVGTLMEPSAPKKRKKSVAAAEPVPDPSLIIEEEEEEQPTEENRIQPGESSPADEFLQVREREREREIEDIDTEMGMVQAFVFSDCETKEQFTAEDCRQAVELGLSEWCNEEEGHPLTIACRKFNIAWDGVQYPVPENALNQAMLENAYRREFCAFAEILYRSNQAGCYQDDDFKEKIIRIQQAIYYSYMMLNNVCNVVSAYKTYSGLPNDPTIFRFRPFSRNDLGEFHEAIIFCLAKIQELRYVRYQNENFYKRIYNKQNQFVHAYEPAESIETFVYSVASMYSNFDIWKTFSERNNADLLIKYLSRVISPELPVLKKDRYVMSFKNGLYFIKQDRFIEHGSAAIPPTVIACKYHGVDFHYHDSKEVDFQGNEENTGPRYAGTADDIPTPCFDKILKDQDMAYTTRVWFYILYGRLLYWTRDEENWQVWPFFHGLAGTGKSTLCELVSEFYNKDDTGVIPNRIEEKFGLWALYEKLTIYAPEVNSDFGIDRTDLQSMITGETVQIKEKRGKAHSVDWVVPGAMAGNEIPNWNDRNGAMVRRLIIFKYVNKIAKSDSHLIQKLKREIPLIILKCNKFYRAALQYVGQASLWEKLPKYFQDSRSSFQGEVSAIHGFLNSDDVQVVFDEEGKPDERVYIPLTTLRDKYKEWKNNNDIRIQGDRWNSDLYTKALGDKGLGGAVRKTVPYPRDSIVSSVKRIIYGLDTTAEIDRLSVGTRGQD